MRSAAKASLGFLLLIVLTAALGLAAVFSDSPALKRWAVACLAVALAAAVPAVLFMLRLLARLDREVRECRLAGDRLLESKGSLEQEVAARTVELERTNAWLKEEIAGHERTEAELRRNTLELIRTNEDLSRFAFIASHHLQEPLRIASNFAQLLERKYAAELDDKAREYIGYVVGAAKRMSDLVAGLAAYTRAGEALHRGRADVGEALARVREELADVLGEKGVRLEAKGPLPVVGLGRGGLELVLAALVDNGAKFRSGPGGFVEVSARREPGGWDVEVRDDGIGIDPGYENKVFDIFGRLHGEADYPGTGLGLAMARKVVERAGGSIGFESVPGRGTVFTVFLPDPPDTADSGPEAVGEF